MENQVQMNGVTPVVQQPQKKGMPGWGIALIIVGVLAVLGIGAFILFCLVLGSAAMSEYTGSWICDSKYVVDIGGSKFDFYEGTGSYNKAKGSYRFEDSQFEGSTHKYYLTVTFDEVVANGVRQSNAYMSQYQITLDTSNKSQMTLFNSTTGYTYNCIKR